MQRIAGAGGKYSGAGGSAGLTGGRDRGGARAAAASLGCGGKLLAVGSLRAEETGPRPEPELGFFEARAQPALRQVEPGHGISRVPCVAV